MCILLYEKTGECGMNRLYDNGKGKGIEMTEK